jgi:streptogramin lyase
MKKNILKRIYRVLICIACVGLLYTAFPMVAGALIIGEYPIFPAYTISGIESGLAAGPNGDIWFSDRVNDKIGRITPSGVFLAELSTPSAFSGPQQITASPDGLIWFTESEKDPCLSPLLSIDFSPVPDLNRFQPDKNFWPKPTPLLN